MPQEPEYEPGGLRLVEKRQLEVGMILYHDGSQGYGPDPEYAGRAHILKVYPDMDYDCADICYISGTHWDTKEDITGQTEEMADVSGWEIELTPL